MVYTLGLSNPFAVLPLIKLYWNELPLIITPLSSISKLSSSSELVSIPVNDATF